MLFFSPQKIATLTRRDWEAALKTYGHWVLNHAKANVCQVAARRRLGAGSPGWRESVAGWHRHATAQRNMRFPADLRLKLGKLGLLFL